MEQKEPLIEAPAQSKPSQRRPQQRALLYTVLAAAVLLPLACFGLIQGDLPVSRLFTTQCLKHTSGPSDEPSNQANLHRLAKYAVDATATPLLNVFQVYPPVLTPVTDGLALTNGSSNPPASGNAGSTKGCVSTQVLMVHEFSNSYGSPFVGDYSPPANCEFNRVTFNITMASAGRQFDRLWIAYFGDIELWRSSTAEPTATGIIFTYIKDMSSYLSLFQREQKLIFDLGNIIDSTYTGPFNATLTATFFNAVDTVDPADLILPLSTLQGGSGAASAFEYPSQIPETNLTFPRNAQKAVFTISATGQIAEEFWFGNVLESDVNTFGPGFLYGYSPFREVQLYIDGMLAGVVWPFPIIFTGGVVPGLWRPIVGIDAFDLKEDEIDITPWLPLLCDGKTHTFQILVAGISDDGRGNGQVSNTIGNYWVVTGKAFIWLDDAGSVTSGSAIQRQFPNPRIQLTSKVTTNSTGTNKTLTYTVGVSRNLLVYSNVTTSSGTKPAAWAQTLTYSNYGTFTQYGNVQVTEQTTNGLDIGASGYARKISYPITVNTSYNVAPVTNDLTITASLVREQDIYYAGQPVFPTGLQSFGEIPDGPTLQGSHLYTTQNGSARYFALGDNSYSTSSGTTQQVMKFQGLRIGTQSSNAFPNQMGSTELYQRQVLAANGTVVSDEESLLGKPINGFSQPATNSPSLQQYAGGSVMKILGHGPGMA